MVSIESYYFFRWKPCVRFGVDAPREGQLIWLPLGTTGKLARGLGLRQFRCPGEKRL